MRTDAPGTGVLPSIAYTTPRTVESLLRLSVSERTSPSKPTFAVVAA
jgi:hypothetical protein